MDAIYLLSLAVVIRLIAGQIQFCEILMCGEPK